MVSTRHHPRPFPEPTLAPSRTPAKETSASKSSSPTKTSEPPSPTVEPTPTKRTPGRRSARKSTTEAVSEETVPTTSLTRTRSKRRARTQTSTFVHYPDSWAITWLIVSVILVTWDTGYVLGRPHTMPGGRYHNPIWTPYAIYASVDYMYGWPQWNLGNGFTAAQASLNIVESVMYIYYLYVVFTGVAGGWRSGVIDRLFREKSKGRIALEGPNVAFAVLVLWTALIMTLSKTVLYWLNEYFSNFVNVGHNRFLDLLLVFIIPNGLWMVVPSYILYGLGKDIIASMRSIEESHNKDE